VSDGSFLRAGRVFRHRPSVEERLGRANRLMDLLSPSKRRLDPRVTGMHDVGQDVRPTLDSIKALVVPDRFLGPHGDENHGPFDSNRDFLDCLADDVETGLDGLKRVRPNVVPCPPLAMRVNGRPIERGEGGVSGV